MRLPTHMRESKHELKLVWKDEAAELCVNTLVSDAPTLNQFDLAIDEGNMDLAYDTLAVLIVNTVSDANMISRGASRDRRQTCPSKTEPTNATLV